VRIISRYVLREHFGPLVFAMSALTSLLLLNYISKQLPQLVGKGLPWTVIAEFILLSLPFTIAMTLPMAVLVATLHAFSRLAADSEITAFKASGMALPRLMAPVLGAGLFLTALMVWFNDQVMPASNYALQTLTNDIARKKPTFALRPQVINEVLPSRLFLRAGRLEGGSSEMLDVTIFDFTSPTRRRTIHADSGHVELAANGHDMLLTLRNGYMTEIASQEPHRLQRVFFARNHVRVKDIGNDLERNTQGGMKSDREMTVCELQAKLIQAVQTRDSVLRTIRGLSPYVADSLPFSGGAFGSGAAYCGTMRTVLPEQAIAQAPAQSTPPPVVAAVPPDTGGPNPAGGGAGDRPTQAAQAPSIPPSAGILPVAGDSSMGKSVWLESLKTQYVMAERVINGNRVEIEKKFAIATACLVFALLGAPIAFRFPRAGVGLTIGVSLAVFGVYYIGLLGGEELARRGYLPPAIAMWATNAILAVIGLVLTARLGHEGTTTRGSEMSDQLARWNDALLRLLGRKTADA